MSQKFDTILNGKINSFSKKFDIDRIKTTPEDIFEDFSNYVVLSNILSEELEDINKVSTNRSQGIDGIGIIINDRLISDESDLAKVGENEKLVIKLCFIQSTTQSSFDLKKFQSFTDEVVNFLTNQLSIEPFSDIYDKLFDEEGDYIDNLKETPKLSLFFISGCTDHNLDNNTIQSEKQKILNRSEINNKFNLDDIYFFQKNELNEKYEKISKFHTTSLRFHKCVQLEEKNKVTISLLTAIKFEELKKLILTKEENLRDNLFIDNVRSYVGPTKVNEDIKSTLSNNDYNPYFIYLNNGLTIMCESIVILKN
ncbi:MAG: AIPR family protein [Spirochaetota bacterium]|nr:AIPR family protein [Spirochaetota bacterium]